MSIKCSEVVNYNISTGYYRLVMEMFEEEIKYIREYKSLVNDYFKKSLNLQVNLGSKLGKLPDNFANATWLDSSQILKLAQQIPKIIQKQIENLKIFMDEIEKPLNLLDNFFKNKSSEMKKLQQKYDDINNDLVKKYIDIERIKISFTNSINKTEDTIMKSYENKKKIDDAKKGKIKLKEEELKLLNDKNKEYESQKKSLINSTKKYESEYKSIIKTTTKIEDKFIIIINECIIGIKNVVGEITDKFKDTIIAFLTSIRDSFKVPLDLLDNNLTNMKNLNEKEIMDVAMEATFNRESNLKHITPVRYSLRTLENPIIESSKNRSSKGSRGSKGSKGSNGKSKNKNKGENKGNENNNGFVKFEDGFEEMTYFEDDLPLLTVKEMFINFDLINHNGLNIQVEEEKLKLKTLLNKHHNRVIFLHKLNDYRTCSLFELKEKEFQTLGELFSFLIDISKKEEDYHCVEMAIILSKTYYMLENNNKIYIQSLIQNNKYFKTKDFWEALLIYSISKEVIRSKKNDEENKDNQEKLNEKNANIVFSQLLSLIDNMFDFGVDGEMIKQIIEPRIEYYKVDEKSRKPINDYIESKIKAKKKNEK